MKVTIEAPEEIPDEYEDKIALMHHICDIVVNELYKNLCGDDAFKIGGEVPRSRRCALGLLTGQVDMLGWDIESSNPVKDEEGKEGVYWSVTLSRNIENKEIISIGPCELTSLAQAVGILRDREKTRLIQ